MTDSSIKLAFIPIARPTFDVALAQEQTDAVRARLRSEGYTLYGPDELIVDMDHINDAVSGIPEPVDLVFALQASFADSTMLVHLAELIDSPILLWALPEERTGGRLRLNSFCGINLGAHGLRRAGYQYESIFAAPDDDNAFARLRTIARAAQVRRRLKEVRIGRVGKHPAGFDTCRVNQSGLREQLGVEVVQLDLQNVFKEARKAPDSEIDAVLSTVQARVAGVDAVEQEPMRGTLATYLTLKSEADRNKLNGMAVRCWPEFFTELGCAACGAMSMLSDESIPSSCEADVNGTITQFILQTLAGAPAFGADVVDFDTAGDTAVLWHCGLAPLSMADPDAVAEATIHSNRRLPLLMQFPLKPGRVTLARLSEATGHFRLVIGTGEMLRAPLAFSGTSGTVRFDNGAEQVMNTILSEGLEHHLSLTYGDHADALLALARMLNLPVLRL